MRIKHKGLPLKAISQSTTTTSGINRDYSQNGSNNANSITYSKTSVGSPVEGERKVDLEAYNMWYEEGSFDGIFFILKGQYKKHMAPTVIIEGEEGKRSVGMGGYDPSNHNNQQWSKWYMVLDKVTFNTIYCGPSLERALSNITHCIERCGTPKKYFKEVSDVTSEDWYEVHYLGRKPLTSEGIATKKVGKCPRVSPTMKEHYKAAYLLYGDLFSEEVEAAVEKGMEKLKEKEAKRQARKAERKNRNKRIKLKGIPVFN